MFTGLIETTGRLLTGTDGAPPSPGLHLAEAGCRIVIETSLGAQLSVGDSIAVNGVCLTAVVVTPTGFEADVSPQTVRVTTAADWKTGTRVNLERPLKAGASLGGHFVLGHVDGVSRLLVVRPESQSYWLEFALPAELAKYVIPKGSIAVDGISLTVAELTADRFAVQIVPHTWLATTLSERAVGDAVNLEADVLGKHVARLVELGRTV